MNKKDIDDGLANFEQILQLLGLVTKVECKEQYKQYQALNYEKFASVSPNKK